MCTRQDSNLRLLYFAAVLQWLRRASGTSMALVPSQTLASDALCSVRVNSRAAAAAPMAPADRKPREERQDSTDHCDCADSSDPVLSKDPAEIRDRAEPIEPTDRALPTEPTDRAEPTDPMDNTDPTEPIDSTEPCDHRDKMEPDEVCRVDSTDSLVMRPPCS